MDRRARLTTSTRPPATARAHRSRLRRARRRLPCGAARIGPNTQDKARTLRRPSLRARFPRRAVSRFPHSVRGLESSRLNPAGAADRGRTRFGRGLRRLGRGSAARSFPCERRPSRQRSPRPASRDSSERDPNPRPGRPTSRVVHNVHESFCHRSPPRRGRVPRRTASQSSPQAPSWVPRGDWPCAATAARALEQHGLTGKQLLKFSQHVDSTSSGRATSPSYLAARAGAALPVRPDRSGGNHTFAWAA